MLDILPVLLLLALPVYLYVGYKNSWKGRLSLKNPRNGRLRDAPIGFSWTTLFFGPIPALLREHWTGALVMVVVNIFTFGVAWVVFALFYNKFYVKHLIRDGYFVSRLEGNQADIERALGFELPMLESSPS